MASQKPLKMAIGQISLAYNQAAVPLNTAEGGVATASYLKKS
jgi:hypothetical protein